MSQLGFGERVTQQLDVDEQRDLDRPREVLLACIQFC
jgi:hypothetical protein